MASRVDMTDLRMHQPVNRRAVHQHATADSRADGEIHKRFDLSRRSPPVLGQSRRVDVGIETDGTREFSREDSRNVGAAPSRLGRSTDEAVTVGSLVEFHRTERGDTDRREGAERLTPLAQEGPRGRKRRGRISGGEALLGEDVSALVAYGTNELGAAGLDSTEKAWRTGHGVE